MSGSFTTLYPVLVSYPLVLVCAILVLLIGELAGQIHSNVVIMLQIRSIL